MLRVSSIKPSVKTALVASFALLVALGCSARTPAPEDHPWETRGFDQARTNRAPEATEMPPKTLWKKVFPPAGLLNLYSRIEGSSPVMAGGLVYLGSANGKFYAINRAGGWTAWLFNAGSPIESGATLYDGKVCFGSATGVLRCLKATTGEELWSFQARSEIITSPLAASGRLFFLSSDDRLYALDIDSGEKLWGYSRGTFKTVVTRNTSSPALAAGWDKGGRGGEPRVLQLFSDGMLVCLDAASGRTIWEKRVLDDTADGLFRRTPLVMNGTVYMINGTGAVAAYSVADGSQVGLYSMEKAVDFVFLDPRTLVIAGAGSVTAVDTGRGRALWNRTLELAPARSIFASGTHIFVLSNHTVSPFGIELFSSTNGYVQALSIADGRTEWTKRLGSTVSADGSTSGGTVPLVLDSGRLVLFATKHPAPAPSETQPPPAPPAR